MTLYGYCAVYSYNQEPKPNTVIIIFIHKQESEIGNFQLNNPLEKKFVNKFHSNKLFSKALYFRLSEGGKQVQWHHG